MQDSKIPKSLCELAKTGKYSLSPTFKNVNFESMNELEKNSFENKIGNLHDIKLFPFQK